MMFVRPDMSRDIKKGRKVVSEEPELVVEELLEQVVVEKPVTTDAPKVYRALMRMVVEGVRYNVGDVVPNGEVIKSTGLVVAD
jgi:hypothetical protein